MGGGGHPKVGSDEVAEMIDIVRLGLSAGLSFDAALGLYCEQRDGELAARLEAARLSWQIGVDSRSAVLQGVVERTHVAALDSFVRAVVQALEMGAPLAGTLEEQARACRAMRRSEIEGRIERAPIKILVPTGTLILPALLLSILGPLLAAGGML